MRTSNGVPRHSMNGISPKFRRMAELYRYFARSMTSTLDLSDAAMLALYNHESYGTPLPPENGFAVGKRYLNLQVTTWREDLQRGLLARHELYEDPALPHWWLDSVLQGLYDGFTYRSLVRACRPF